MKLLLLLAIATTLPALPSFASARRFTYVYEVTTTAFGKSISGTSSSLA
jgi:hypothetical protein